MSDDLIGLREAAKRIGIEPSTLVYVIDVGDVVPTIPIPLRTHLSDGSVWPQWTEAQFTMADIERYKIEMRRRRFADFKTEYADIYQEDSGPGARGLEFGPGWEGILRAYADGLRAIQANGHRVRLRWAKEKFGALQLFNDYDDDAAEDVGRLKGIAYRASLQACQECGEPARLRWGDFICLTLCERHKHLVGDPDPEKDGIILDVDAWSREQREKDE